MDLEQICERIRTFERELATLKEAVAMYILHHDARRTQTRPAVTKLFSMVSPSQTMSTQSSQNPQQGALSSTMKISPQSQQTLDETLIDEEPIPLRRHPKFRIDKP